MRSGVMLLLDRAPETSFDIERFSTFALPTWLETSKTGPVDNLYEVVDSDPRNRAIPSLVHALRVSHRWLGTFRLGSLFYVSGSLAPEQFRVVGVEIKDAPEPSLIIPDVVALALQENEIIN